MPTQGPCACLRAARQGQRPALYAVAMSEIVDMTPQGILAGHSSERKASLVTDVYAHRIVADVYYTYVFLWTWTYFKPSNSVGDRGHDAAGHPCGA